MRVSKDFSERGCAASRSVNFLPVSRAARSRDLRGLGTAAAAAAEELEENVEEGEGDEDHGQGQIQDEGFAVPLVPLVALLVEKRIEVVVVDPRVLFLEPLAHFADGVLDWLDLVKVVLGVLIQNGQLVASLSHGLLVD